MTKKTILIIDDHPLFRKGVQQLLNMDEQYEIVGEAADGVTGLAMIESLAPDMVLLDLNMEVMSGLDVLEEIKKRELDTEVVIMTVSNQDSDVARAIHLGADGYLLKDMEPEDILLKLGQVAEGNVVMDENISMLLANMLKSGSHFTTLENVKLTQRETEIMGLLVVGMNNKLMARELNISDGTVKVHIKNILRKTKVNSRLEAAVWAINHGFEKP
jgi:two-component system nitrate/nitrite response regulator NarL